MSGGRRNVVVRSIDRPDPATVAALAEAGVATVHEAMGRRGLLGAEVSAVHRGNRIAGPAVTVSCQAGDNLMIHAAVEVVREGDVLVVTTTSPSVDGMFGELLATSLKAAGCIGLVIDAGVRDVAELGEMGFPVWARAVHSQGTVKATPGSVNIPVVCAGAAIAPGDVVVADDDGVVVVPGRDCGAVVDAAAARLDREAKVRAQLRDGVLGLDLYGLRPRLADLGVEYVEDASELG